jgi:hypothetical protein
LQQALRRRHTVDRCGPLRVLLADCMATRGPHTLEKILWVTCMCDRCCHAASSTDFEIEVRSVICNDAQSSTAWSCVRACVRARVHVVYIHRLTLDARVHDVALEFELNTHSLTLVHNEERAVYGLSCTRHTLNLAYTSRIRTHFQSRTQHVLKLRPPPLAAIQQQRLASSKMAACDVIFPTEAQWNDTIVPALQRAADGKVCCSVPVITPTPTLTSPRAH